MATFRRITNNSNSDITIFYIDGTLGEVRIPAGKTILASLSEFQGIEQHPLFAAIAEGLVNLDVTEYVYENLADGIYVEGGETVAPIEGEESVIL